MTWYSAFYLGGVDRETVLIPIETITFEAADAARFETGDPAPDFNFTGEPVFQPLTDDADFDVEC